MEKYSKKSQKRVDKTKVMCYNSQAVERDGITKRCGAQKLPIEERKRAKPKNFFKKISKRY